MLKRKAKLNYRRGYTHSNCGCCDHFQPQCQLQGIGDVELPPGPRCKIVGLEPGRMYQVSRKNICDRFDNTLTLKRIKGEL